MARKKLTPEQKAEKKALRAKKNFRNFEVLVTLVLIALSIACLIFIVSFGFGIQKPEKVGYANNEVAIDTSVSQGMVNNTAKPDAPSVETKEPEKTEEAEETEDTNKVEEVGETNSAEETPVEEPVVEGEKSENDNAGFDGFSNSDTN